MRRTLAVLLAALPAALGLLCTSCYGDPDSFIVAKAKYDCIRLAECNRSFFEDAYNGDMAECRQEVEDGLDSARDLLEALNQDYDQDEGQECISVSRSLKHDCSNNADDDIADACDRVYH